MKTWSKNKKTLNLFKSLLLVLFCFFLLFPQNTFAILGIEKAILSVPVMVVAILLALVVMITEGLAKVAASLLDMAINPSFLKHMGYTKNPLIDVGLSITQEFVNLFLVVALVYIAVSIALRLANEAQAKKMLFWLIFIALIVNFAPVICGIIVDASNILINYFLEGIKEGVADFLKGGTQGGDIIVSSLLALGDLKGQILLVTQAILQAFINSAIFFVFLIFAAIFMLRFLIIWILVILAPLAFVSVIIPQTKALIWNRWWSYFIEWSFIGVPAAFFLYLGSKFCQLIPILKLSEAPSGTSPLEIIAFAGLTKHLAYLISATFFVIGFLATVSITGQGSRSLFSILKSVKQKGAQKIKPVARQVSDVIRGVPRVQRAEEKIRTKLETVPLVGRVVGGPGAFEREKRKEFETAYKSLVGIPVQDLEKRLAQPVTTRKQRFERAAAIQHLLEKEAFDEQKHGKYVAEALSLGLKKSDFYKRRPDLAKTFLNMRIKDVMSRILPSEVPKIHARAFENDDVVVDVALDAAKYDKLARDGSEEAKRRFKQTLVDILEELKRSGKIPAKRLKEIEKRVKKVSNDPRFPK